MSGFIIYHPARCVQTFGNTTVYFDKPTRNQDPYIWNRLFLHSYCHITQRPFEKDDINFWVNSPRFRGFTELYCDLVFVVGEKIYWKHKNHISRNDPIVDSAVAYNDHYRWGKYEHHFTRHRRFTLKANSKLSFQPQGIDGKLLDILPFLVKCGLGIDELRIGMQAGFSSQPLEIEHDLALRLYEYLNTKAKIKLTGTTLARIRKLNTHLASPSPRKK